ncbi:MAG: intradiol ring-cleavage dioxygenase [Bacteroidia bacterium]|nr:intradiol ring-cleavage dioxygenase [Bacteroidia bacterium]
MKREKFLKTGIKALGVLTVVPIVLAATQNSTLSNQVGDCDLTPSETAGPFPTKNPAAFQIADIRSDRKGVDLEIAIHVQNLNNKCAPLPDAIVDIWLCDKDGYYSEYGGMRMQRQDFSAAHFLRGRQISDNKGKVGFRSIFPGWYPGRAPHIHVHIFDAKGNSLLVTQIAFPEKECNTVYTKSEFYTRGLQDTPNNRDGVFGSSLEAEMGELAGNISAGYTLTHTINVDA